MQAMIKAIFPEQTPEAEAIAAVKKYDPNAVVHSFNPIMFQGTRSFACLVTEIDDAVYPTIESEGAFSVDFMPEITQCPSPTANKCGTKGKCC